MNVLALCADPGVPLDGNKGASVHLRAVWNALAAAGCRVHGVAPSRGGSVPAFHPGVSIHPIVADRGELSSEIARIARDLPADVLLERLALGATAGLTIARDRHLPRVVEVNAPLDDEATRFRVEPGAAAIEAMSASLREADATYVVSSALVAWAQRHGARQVRVIPNGVDVAAFAGVRRSRGAGRVRAIFVGTFKPWHGVELLMDATVRAIGCGADLELELVGEGPDRAAAERRAREAGITERTRFIGSVAHERIATHLLESEIAVVPAPRDVASYFSPLKIYEYAAAGCAIVAADYGQVSERFVHGENAWLVPAGDVEALAGALERLTFDTAHRERLGAAAREMARNLDWSLVAGQLRECMETLVHERSRA